MRLYHPAQFSSRLSRKAVEIMNLETSSPNSFVCNKPIHLKLLNKSFSLNRTLQESMYFLLYNFVELL